jgi:apolipoprotein N-acyltransferase
MTVPMRKYSRAILTGILVGTSFIPFYPWAIYFCWIPIWREWVDNPDAKKVFFHGWIAQFVFTLIGFHWISHVASEFGHLPAPVSYFVLIAFASFANLHVPLAGLVWSYLERRFMFRREQNFVLLALILIVFEYFFPMIFPWNMGYAWLYAEWPSYHWADVFGFQGLSALTILINLLVAIGMERAFNRISIRPIVISLAAVLLILNGGGEMRNIPWQQTDSKLSFLQIQANIGNFEKYYAERKGMFRDYILDRYVEQTRTALKEHPDADVILWPETAIPERLDEHFKFTQVGSQLRSRIKEFNKPLITGGYSAEVTSPQIYNAMFFFNAQGELAAAPYRKNILLAFGEYFPGAQWFPKLKELVPEISDFGRGKGPVASPILNYYAGPQICYEGLFPAYSKEMVNQGAQMFVNTTNDSWYDTLFEPHQHMYMTLGRAIEFRRPLVRVTNTGISTAILANGKILERTKMNETTQQLVTLHFQKDARHTFFERNGQYWPVFFLLLFFGYLGRAIVVKEKRRA